MRERAGSMRKQPRHRAGLFHFCELDSLGRLSGRSGLDSSSDVGRYGQSSGRGRRRDAKPHRRVGVSYRPACRRSALGVSAHQRINATTRATAA
ncbi:hypothetical protein WS70_07395 [Burkholderia mayonis]|uniref:Uncharacterized protein n=1 Tax=Burkholderia mayonis TaxID=1385591 RepID=A0A1B4FDC2_9BURK|nr:hypothetical protein WS70_07395 [Burkholderia mayonis]